MINHCGDWQGGNWKTLFVQVRLKTTFFCTENPNFLLKLLLFSLGEGGAGVAAAEPSGDAARGAGGARPALALVDCRGARPW